MTDDLSGLLDQLKETSTDQLGREVGWIHPDVVAALAKVAVETVNHDCRRHTNRGDEGTNYCRMCELRGRLRQVLAGEETT